MARRRNAHPSKSKTDLFTPTRRATSGKRKPGRPPVHDEAWTKVTVVLFNRQIVLLASLLDAVADADIDLTASLSEADLKATLLARLGKYRMGL